MGSHNHKYVSDNGTTNELRKLFFLPQLKPLGLTTQQISSQLPEELETSLLTVNDAIERADSFGVFRIKIDVSGFVVVATSDEAHTNISILSLLLEAKKLILERLAEIRKQKPIDNLEELVIRVSDDSVRDRLSQELGKLKSEVILWRSKFEEIETQQSQEIEKLQIYSAEQIGQLTATLKSIKLARLIYRSLFGVLVGILGISVILYFPSLLSWEWLLIHPKKIPIQVSLCLVTLGITWSIVDGNSNRRLFALGSIVVAAFLGILGLI